MPKVRRSADGAYGRGYRYCIGTKLLSLANNPGFDTAIPLAADRDCFGTVRAVKQNGCVWESSRGAGRSLPKWRPSRHGPQTPG
jgi:hypothetical protein